MAIEVDITLGGAKDVSKELFKAIEANELRLKTAPFQWMLGEMLTRIHVRAENSNNEPMSYKSAQYIRKRFNKGLRIDGKNLQFEKDSLLNGLQLVIVGNSPTIQLIGNRVDGDGSIPLNQLAAWQEEIEGTKIWKPTDKEIEGLALRYKKELDAVVKEIAAKPKVTQKKSSFIDIISAFQYF